MKVAAIIAEYNPFHNGHMYQINRVREIMGSDTAIIAIMSGNFTQRGEIAIADKTVRAKSAVDCGVNLVLELPFPYSMSSAEFFAKSGVYIADKLCIVDYLVFGSECGDIIELSKIAEIFGSEEFQAKLRELEKCKEHKNLGFPQLCEMAYKSMAYDICNCDFTMPNNILAIEYLRALMEIDSKIEPITIKRIGANYNEDFVCDTEIQSASAIRSILKDHGVSALDYVPDKSKNAIRSAIQERRSPSNIGVLDSAIIAHFRLNTRDTLEIHDASGGLYNRLCNTSMKANSISSLMTASSTKKYTDARIRRAIWYSYFGVTSSDVKKFPAFTQVLAMDKIGCALLKRIQKISSLSVITKPASYKGLSSDVIAQKELSNKADSVFALTFSNPYDGNFALTFTPYVKK